MKYYLLDCNFYKRDTPAYIEGIESSGYDDFHYNIFYGKPIECWPDSFEAICIGNPSGSDIVPGMNHCPYVSASARKAFEDFGKLSLQFLPVNIRNRKRAFLEKYFMLHIISVCSSLDVRRTPHDTSVVDGGLIIVGRDRDKIVLSSKKLAEGDYAIYREKRCESLIIMREDLVNHIESSGLKGFHFKQLKIN